MGPSSDLPIMPYPAFRIASYEAQATEIVHDERSVDTAKPKETTITSEDVTARSEPTRQAVIDNINGAESVDPAADTEENEVAAPILALTQSLEPSSADDESTIDFYS
jgi:hypothetical protein